MGDIRLTAVAGDGAVAVTWESKPVDEGYLLLSRQEVDGGASATYGGIGFYGSPAYFVDSGLENGRTYRYRIIVSDQSGMPQMQSPPVLATPTPGATACLTLPPTAITDTSVTVKGLVLNPPGRITSVSFDVGSTSVYGASKAASSTAVAGASEVSYTVAPLSPGSEQHYRVVAKNADGTCTGDDRLARTWRSAEILASGLQEPAGLVLGADTIYFAERWGNRIAKIAKSGGIAETLVPASGPAALTGDESVLYVAESNGIRRIDVQASSSTELTAEFSPSADYGLSLAESHLYWRRTSPTTIVESGIYGIPVSGGTPAKVFTGPVNDFDARGGTVYCSVTSPNANVLWKVPANPGAQPVALASLSLAFVDVLAAEGWLYYTELGIFRISVDGGVPERLVRAGNGSLLLVGADASHLYYAEGPLIRKIPLAGGEVTTLAYGGEGAYPSNQAFAVDDTHVYWSRMNGITPGTGAILRAPKD